MTISNGSTIAKTDADALTSTQLFNIAVDTIASPIGGEVNFAFPGLTAALLASNPERCKAVFTAPYDLLLEVVAVQTGDHVAASTTTVTLSSSGVLDAFPVSVTGTTGVGLTKLTRVLYDGVGKRTTRAVRVIPKGAEVEVDVTTNNTAAASTIQVCVAYRQFFARS